MAIGQAPPESKLLACNFYAALAESEGLMIGAEKIDETAIPATVSSISERTSDIESLLRQSQSAAAFIL